MESNNTTPLCEIAYKYGTDKCPQLRHAYTPVYYELLKDKQQTIKKVLEMGIGYYKTMKHVATIYDAGLKRHYHRGASLLMWRDFFPNAQIYGADIHPDTLFEDERIKTFLCDETNEEELKELINIVGSDIDLFIDDGSHKQNHQIFMCQILMPLFQKDVIYIIEDVKYPENIIKQLTNYNCQIITCNSFKGGQEYIIKIRKKI